MSRRNLCRFPDCRAEILFVPLTERPRQTACLDAGPVPMGDALGGRYGARLVRVVRAPSSWTAVVLSGEHLNRAVADGERLYAFHSEICLRFRSHNPMPDRVRAQLAALTSPEENR